MPQSRVAILCPPDPEAPTQPSARFNPVASAFRASGADCVAIAFEDDQAEMIGQTLATMHAVLVWINPLRAGRDRGVLDALLRATAARGVLVSAHPDVILRMGTKEVLWASREMTWSTGDVHRYRSPAELQAGLAARLSAGAPRVLKQYRGNDGQGVWRVEPCGGPGGGRVRVLHAAGGSQAEEMALDAFVARCADYFAGSGRMIDQPFVSPIPNGMVRVYLTRDRVVGFGHQLVTALVPPVDGGPVPAPPPRRYFPADQGEYQGLRLRMETEWVGELGQVVGVAATQLPLIWDADFLITEPTRPGDAGYRLCEINVSSVFPFPESALAPIVATTLEACRR